MPTLVSAYRRIQPWIAMAAAYAVALQLVLTAFGGPMHAAEGVAGDAFVVCLNSHDNGGDPGQLPVHKSPCVLCAMAQGFAAISPIAANASAIVVAVSAIVFSERSDRTIAHRSPTGQYQRGPPAGTTAAG